MIIVLKPGATKKEIDHIKKLRLNMKKTLGENL